MSSFIKIFVGLAIIAVVVSAIVYFVGGNDDNTSNNTTSQQGQGGESQNSGEALASDSAQYQITFDAVWSKDNGHTVIPDGAHFSPFIAWTHTKGLEVFRSGGFASEGVKVMAETGAPQPLLAELEREKQAGRVGMYVTGSLLYSPGSVQRMIEPTQQHRYITVVSMLAPSPDWFVAVRDFELFAENQWRAGFSNYETLVYDAGTDSGTSFTAEDQPTEPQQPIQRLEEVNVEEGGGAIARISIALQ